MRYTVCLPCVRRRHQHAERPLEQAAAVRLSALGAHRRGHADWVDNLVERRHEETHARVSKNA